MTIPNLKKYYSLWLLALSLISTSAWSNGGIVLGATRIIYPLQAKQMTIPVRNTSNDASYLVQSWVEEDNGEKSKSFIVTPPLFKSGTQHENILRLIYTGKPLPADRESLYYFNTKGIPAVEKDKIAGNNALILATVTRIKLFMRPEGLKILPQDAPKMLRFRQHNNKLQVINPSPYYLTLTDLKAGTKDLGNLMVAPFSNDAVSLPAGSGQAITFSTINDYGGLTSVQKGIYQ